MCVDQVSVTKQRFSLGLHVEYRVYGEDTSITTHTVHDTLDAKFDHSHQVSLDVLDKEHLHYFDDGCIMFHVYAHQSNLPPDLGKSLMTTTVSHQSLTNRSYHIIPVWDHYHAFREDLSEKTGFSTTHKRCVRTNFPHQLSTKRCQKSIVPHSRFRVRGYRSSFPLFLCSLISGTVSIGQCLLDYVMLLLSEARINSIAALVHCTE